MALRRKALETKPSLVAVLATLIGPSKSPSATWTQWPDQALVPRASPKTSLSVISFRPRKTVTEIVSPAW